MLDVVCREIVPDNLRNIFYDQRKRYFEDFQDLLTNTFIKFLCIDDSWLTATLSTKQRFCWVILSTCCNKIITSYEDFDWAKYYSPIIRELKLGMVFSEYCKKKKLIGDNCIIASNLPDDIKSHPSKDLRKYVKMQNLGEVVLFQRFSTLEKFWGRHW